ncbi:two-component sensor histidine kinase [Clavibacter tessellarius]|uniref:histidine kinase n=1 Tax=Clavibacter tessellarius TaxID=31965 RepID=A0A225CDZ5_9MICO|nr:histidine kinase [Clavibacter michiganensis]OQJ61975.1 two-component sensor histidine kinase [Clavibacter michiganensis subsp. tessellarius]UKF35029.1 two-component sensor histidine kinase [Clavibacter michiganensis subsp. tessellarius]
MSSPSAPAPRLRIPGRTRAVGRETALVALSVVVGLVAFGATLTFVDEAGVAGSRAAPLLLLDAGAGLLGIALLPLRRLAPVTVAVALGAISAVSSLAFLAALIALVSLAARRRPREIAPVALAWILAIGGWELSGLALLPSTSGEHPLLAAVLVAGVGLVIAVGLYVGGRRELLASLRERARLADEEQALRAAQAADHERTRIAREMHDVLAHRLSLVALHAGALEYRDDLDPGEVRRTAGVVRDNARTALTELREVLGVLRDPQGSPAAAPPQPTLADLPALLDEARALGVAVRVDVADGTRDDLPRLGVTTSRHAYRIVQECLTNARRHAPGAPVEVAVSGRAGGELRIAVANPLPGDAVDGDVAAAPADGAPAGHGLTGLAERARAVHGTLGVARIDGRHVVEAVLPWAA